VHTACGYRCLRVQQCTILKITAFCSIRNSR